MRSPFLAVAAVCALGVATACSSPGTPAPSPASARAGAGASAAAPVASRGGYAFPTQDAPYESILAEAQRTGRPALLFFWTSW